MTTVTYDIGEYREMIGAATHDDPNASLEGLGSLQGVVQTRDGSSLPFGRDALTLHLGDGRRLRVFCTRSAGGSSAEVRGTGGLF